MDMRADAQHAKKIAMNLDVPLPLVARISYHDVAVVQQIISRLLPDNKKSDSKPAPAKAVPANLSGYIFETFDVSLAGLRVILIDDMNNLHLPMFDMSVSTISVQVQNWSSRLSVETSVPLQLNYFDINNSHWEPVVEPCTFDVNVQQNDKGAFAVNVTNAKKLDVNVSHDLVSSVLQVMHRF